MGASPIRVIFDTNVMLRGLISLTSPAAKVLDAVDQRKFVLLLSRPIIAEYRRILSEPELEERYPDLTLERVETTIARFRFLGEYLRRVTERFDYPRDPLDSKFIELAIAGRATHLITYDADLLDLPNGHDESAKRFRQRMPHLQVIQPIEFLRGLGAD